MSSRWGLLVALALVATACGGGQSKEAAGVKTPQRGGDLVIARVADSQSMDKTTVFDNESIWIFEQVFETLYTVRPDGQGVIPWLATAYDLSPDKLTYTLHLRPGVKFSTGTPMTSTDVKFSIDEARAASQGWGYIDTAIKDVQAPDPATVVIHTKFPWAPLIADLALFSNGIIPANYGGVSKAAFYQHRSARARSSGTTGPRARS